MSPPRRTSKPTTPAPPTSTRHLFFDELYHSRWRIEVHLRHLKQTMGMDGLRCQSVEGVLKELWMFMLVYNLVRRSMLDAADR